MTNRVDIKDLVKAGVHFGHQTSRWCPKMAPYIWGYKNNVHLIDVSKTAAQIEKAAKFLETTAAEGKTILWVGTKKPAQDIIKTIATQLDMPYVNHRWIGGTLSNFSQVKKSVTKLLHYKDIIEKADKYSHYTKKEFNVFQKIVNRLNNNIGGILNLQWPVGAVVLVDVTKERSALREAAAVGIPVVAIVDTNGDPSLVDYVIPANDDAPRAIKIIFDFLMQAAQKGKEAAKVQGKEKQHVAQSTEPVMDEAVALALADAEKEDDSGKRSNQEGIKRRALKKVDIEEENKLDKRVVKPVNKNKIEEKKPRI